MNGELIKTGEYSLQKRPNSEAYRIGFPGLPVRNIPLEQGEGVQTYVDLEAGAVVYLWDEEGGDYEQ